MTKQPKISIIIPVYNVEQYLRQCMDSVVNQTLRDIQIVCVNDGSTDGSLGILREYAASDSRIEIIDKPNGGLPSARNAGIAHVRGKYTYHLDSDDWIELTLCEKTYYRLERSGADVIFFFYNQVAEAGQERRIADIDCNRWSAVSSTSEQLFSFVNAAWNRVIRTSFYQNLNVRIPEEFLPDDLWLHWIILANEPKVEIIPEKLHYYRLRGTSIMGRSGEYVAKCCLAFALIRDYLQSVGKYEQYRTVLLTDKIQRFITCAAYPNALLWFRESLDDDEMDFLRNDESLDPGIRNTVLDLLDKDTGLKSQPPTFRQKLKKIERKAMRPLKNLLKKTNRVVFRPLEKFVRRIRANKTLPPPPPPVENPADRQIRELSELVCQLSKEVVELRERLACSESVKKRVKQLTAI